MTSSPSALLLTAPPIQVVRIAIVGVGQRGLKTIARYSYIDGAEIVALADLSDVHFAEAQRLLTTTGRAKATMYTGSDAARSVCALSHVDVVIICTDWFSHTDIAVMAMESGKNVAVEVPAAMSISDCWRLIRTSERTRKHCFMLENCCFDAFALATLNVARQGRLGEIKHCEGAYIHNLHVSRADARPHASSSSDAVYSWMQGDYPYPAGNAYPTHGIGPIALLLNVHRGNRFTELFSFSSTPTSPLPQRVCTVLLRTQQGQSVMLQLDVHTPRPYSRLQTICGSQGYASKYPLPTMRLAGMPQELVGDEATAFAEAHLQAETHRFVAEARAKCVENEMNYTMDARFIYCLRNGLPLDIDVYDAAEWSCITELSAQSEASNAPIPFPDFTEGRWQDLSGHSFYI